MHVRVAGPGKAVEKCPRPKSQHILFHLPKGWRENTLKTRAETIISGWWYTYPSQKYESQLGLLFPIYGKIKHVPNHQPDIISITHRCGMTN